MTTFSQLVDAIIAETRRPDMRGEIISYTNQTLREVHFRPDTNAAALYRDNLREARLVANVDAGFGWEIPDPATFQAMQAVRYDSLGGVYPPEKVPSRGLQGLDRFYYRAGTRYAFSGYGGSNAILSLAYYEYPRRLLYKELSQRYAQYDPESGWTYGAGAVTPDLQLVARTLSSNWLLMRWVDVILEGVRAKVYKRVSDTDRARTCYSLYLALRQGLYTSESADLGGYA